MIKNIIYIISIISLVILSFLTIEMLPIVFQSSWQGIFLLISIILLLLIELFIIIKNQKESSLHYIYIILITMYFSILYYKVYSSHITSYLDYDMKISYCKQNYLMISFLTILLIVNLFMKHRDVNKK